MVINNWIQWSGVILFYFYIKQSGITVVALDLLIPVVALILYAFLEDWFKDWYTKRKLLQIKEEADKLGLTGESVRVRVNGEDVVDE